MRKVLLLFFFVHIKLALYSQDSVRIALYPFLQNRILMLNQPYYLLDDTLKVETLKFYLSHISFYKNHHLVGTANRKHYLVDFEKSTPFVIETQISADFDAMGFMFGVDSLTSESGVYGEDLDPTNGMYWSWQTGYINFKLEGTSQRCTSRNHRFQWHIGGYLQPFVTNQEMKLSTTGRKIRIGLFLDDIIEQLNTNQWYEIMSPNQKAVEISNLIAQSLHIYE